MASPFRHFRKYTGVFMVALCALLMLAFVVADPLMQYLGSGRGGGNGQARNANEVAVSWRGGDLTEGELGRLVAQRQLLKTFHDTVIAFGNETARGAGTLDLQLSVQPLQLATTPQQGVEQNVVQSKILTDAARNAGMTVSDEVVLDYLRSLGRNYVDNEQLRFILGRMAQGSRRRLSFDFLLNLLREAILARNFQQSYVYSFSTVLPQQRYRDWLSVNDRVVVEAAALKAEDYLSEVAEPTPVELEEFFNEHKDRQPSPDFRYGPELPASAPGFSAPRRVTLQYLRADFQAVFEATQAKVTDEEIAKYYQENKELYVKSDDLLSGDPLGGGLFDDKAEEDAADDKDPADDKDTDAANQSGSTDDNQDANADGSGDGKASENTTEKDQAPEDKPIAAESEAGPAPADDPTPADKPTEGASSAAPRKNPFRLVVLQEEPDPEADNPEQPTEDPAAAGGSGADSDASDKPDQEPGDRSQNEEDEQDGDEEDKVEYKPLDEVSDEIRRQLAQQQARLRVREIIAEVQADLRKQYNQYFTEVVVNTPQNETPEPPPAALSDLRPYAKKHNLELTEVRETNLLAFRKTDLGNTYGDSGATANQSLLAVLFGNDAENLDNYDPIVAQNYATDDRYLVQRLENLEPRTPELDEVREQVVAAWKRMKAGELALAAAEKKAEEAEESGDTLADFFRGDRSVEVVETQPFSKLTYGLLDQQTREAPLQISQPDEIAAAGPELLDAVFEQDGVIATRNHDGSIAYVVRVVRHVESPSELRRGFLDEGGFWFGQQTMDRNRAGILRAAFFADLVGEEGLDWKRQPDQAR